MLSDSFVTALLLHHTNGVGQAWDEQQQMTDLAV